MARRLGERLLQVLRVELEAGLSEVEGGGAAEARLDPAASG